jgi:hypothetical protein
MLLYFCAVPHAADPCLQSDVYTGSGGADLAGRLSVSSREIPQATPANGTLMARDLGRRVWMLASLYSVRAALLAVGPRPDPPIIAEDPPGNLSVSVRVSSGVRESAVTQTILWMARSLVSWIQETQAHYEPSRS